MKSSTLEWAQNHWCKLNTCWLFTRRGRHTHTHTHTYIHMHKTIVALTEYKWNKKFKLCSYLQWSDIHSVVPDSLRPHGLYSLWNSPGQNTGVVAFPFSRGSSQPRDQIQISCIAGEFFTSWAIREALVICRPYINLGYLWWSKAKQKNSQLILYFWFLMLL